MSEVTGITLIMENCEEIYVPQKAIKELSLFDIERNLSVNSKGFMTDELWCDTAVLEFNYQLLNSIQTDAFIMSGRSNLGDRLAHFKDITIIVIEYGDDQEMSIRVPWDSRNDTYNLKMAVSVDKRFNTEKVLITNDDNAITNFCFYNDIRD
ncbi:hypothetical protein [Limosilactobacillus albertensis]|uniref:Uncharacterized protein n=2 Tax=Limosilactobacillus albertensis TaxID=2759752 RepID=A0A839H2A4_9LACO|nr:hypothetical protein [Limosilactobacillus albertensis]MBB1122460.1 hypothetical protein [Limosilactobacillus albertensis]MCD7121365.1 hypothetical protein [Limosilactobacillus albertensis]